MPVAILYSPGVALPSLASSGLAGEGLGIILLIEAKEERVVGLVEGGAALIGVVGSFLVSSTASFRISSPVGPFFTSSWATCS